LKNLKTKFSNFPTPSTSIC